MGFFIFYIFIGYILGKIVYPVQKINRLMYKMIDVINGLFLSFTNIIPIY